MLTRLQLQLQFEIGADLPAEATWLDPVQFEQALHNLIKNAHESGSAAANVLVTVLRVNQIFFDRRGGSWRWHDPSWFDPGFGAVLLRQTQRHRPGLSASA